ncbi:putative Thaumatin family [Helianthus annuus]|uniref:Putative thaumatin n=1 Tax=Helianthus annuus TaxID=4232 RepID=A0A251TF32_HELAN|nr:thaumatin-like protein 1 [Helianthus annuus]KAF5765152.1 putative Thaumatin family [Helianthus annuus]KAJ0451721.1 putative Thaumatin family [Helianthus annuus]KAJ0473606.1 putative Thaumatin family [Helianthus annuus]KAJ0649183.1 putative Thaumatin family [Helianthus annuus]KAJ0652986.1 putative Thaumatin family [Helianthus annuus]
MCSSSLLMQILVATFLVFILKGVSGATFTFVNKCSYTVWPGILGQPVLDTTGFELIKGNSRSLQAPAGWSGRFWGRTGCNFDGSGHGSCGTADCGSGEIECKGAGATPPATLAEFTLGSGPSAQDFYDVSLVDGYNIQMIVEVNGGSGGCGTTGCVNDLNRRCPNELKVASGGACRSACEAFGTPEYCCKGAFGSPESCRPTAYSQVFKMACPRSYSYAYDDATSTFTCTAADYIITFCPSLPSGKSGKDLTKPTNGSKSGPLEGFLSNSSLYADLATSDSSAIISPSSTLIFFISVNFFMLVFFTFVS